MSKEIKKILNQTECPPSKILADYSKGLLSEDEAHVVEVHLIDCEMCSDEIEGMQLFNGKLSEAIEEVNGEIEEKIKESKKSIFFLTNTWMKYAALIVIFIGLGFLVNKFAFYNNEQVNQVAKIEEREIEKNKESKLGADKIEKLKEEEERQEIEGDNKQKEKLKRKPKTIEKEMDKVSSGGLLESDDDISFEAVEEVEEEIVANDIVYDYESETGDQQNKIKANQTPKPKATVASGESSSGNRGDDLKLEDTEMVGGMEAPMQEKADEAIFAEASKDAQPRKARNKRSLNLFSNKKKYESTAQKSAESETPVIVHENANNLYKQKRYSEVLDIYYYAENKEKSLEDNFYIGMSLFKLMKYEESLAFFDFTITNNKLMKDEAIYFKAVALKELGQIEEAKTLLQYLISQKTKFSEKSSALLNEM